MNRYIIEKRDKEVVEKFRAVVESKEQRKRRARIRLFGVLLVFACAGLIILYKNISKTVPEAMMHKSKTVALNRATDDSQSSQKTKDVKPQEPQPNEIAAIQPAANPLPPDTERQSSEQVVPERKATPEPVPVLTPQVKTSGKKGLSEIPVEPARKTGIRVTEIVTCQGIKNLRAVTRQNVFSIKGGARPYVWMDVRSKELPYTLRHVYYLNGRRYCAVPLTIRYPRTRTWSNVTLRNRNEVGKWRVDVVTKQGQTISQVGFTVVP